MKQPQLGSNTLVVPVFPAGMVSDARTRFTLFCYCGADICANGSGRSLANAGHSPVWIRYSQRYDQKVFRNNES